MSRNVLFRLSGLFLLLSVFYLVLPHPRAHAAESKSDQPSAKSSWNFKDFFLGSPAKKKSLKSNVTTNSQEVTPIETLPDVNVIASRLPSDTQKLRDMPSNVTFKDRDAIYESHPLTFQDAVKDAEGVVLYDEVGNGRDTTFSMRGFRGSRDVTFLVDGVRVNEPDSTAVVFPLLPTDDLESVQIERGSSSPVYGSGSFAGVVNITTRKPSEKPISMFGGMEISSFKGIRFNQGFSGTLNDKVMNLGGKWKYYFNGGRDNDGGFREDADSRITRFNIKTGYELPDERGNIHVGVKHVKDAISNPGELTFQQFQNDPSKTNKPLDGRHYENTIVDWGADTNFFDQRLTASYLSSIRYNRSDSYVTFGTFTDFPDGFNPDTNQVRSKVHEYGHVGQIKYEDQWGFFHNESLAGMEFREGKAQNLQRDAFGGQLRNTAVETDRNVNNDSWALFWRETVKLWDRVIPYVGMRHEYARAKTTDFLTPASNISKRWNDSTVSTGLTVKPLDSTDIFFNYSQGFRVPNADELAPFAGAVSSSLRPEKSDSYETGTRLHYKDLAAYKLSYFIIDTKDEILFDSNAVTATTPFGQNINVGKSRRYGIEQRVDLNPVKEIDFYGSYTWLRAYVAETNSTNSPVNGRSLGLLPENRFALGTKMTPFKRLGDPYDGFSLALNGVFTGRQHPGSYESASQATLNSTGGAGHYIKPYSVWDFTTSFKWRGKEIYFKVNNVFNEKYYSRAVNATSFGTALYPSGTYTFVNPGAPREYVGGLRWEFE